jgi:hypothetical protein
MKLNLNRADVTACIASLGSLIKAAAPKEPDMKTNSIEYKVLQENKKLMEKARYAEDLLAKGLKDEHEIELNRSEAKVLIATMLHTSLIQSRVMEQYEKCPEEDPKFAPVDGRRKADYIGRLKARMAEVNTVLDKIRRAL